MIHLKTSESGTILIVVDSNSQSGMLFDYLRGFGFNTLMANNGADALALAAEVEPDLILLDVPLPDINGFETCRRLKAKEATQDIPVIFITAQANTVDKIRGFSLGAVDYITTPIQSEEVIVRLRTHLTLQRLQNTLEQRNERLQQEIAEREQLIAELDAFAHTVAHDLKNPMGVTINYAQFFKNYDDRLSPSDREKYADIIIRNGYKMKNIIDELLLLASVRTEENPLSPLNMADVIEETLNRLAYLLEETDAEIILPDEWPISWGYAPWIEEVWVNYISNAIKYGGNPPRVELGGETKPDGLVQFWIKDNGDGISPEAQAKLFVPFSRLNQARTEGHGLGLSIVQRIMKKLGGKVDVESSGVVGEGSIFSFYLPQNELSFKESNL